MGNFGGHALPGAFFLLFGVWWTIQILIQYYSCLKHNVKFISQGMFPCSCFCGRLKKWPIQPCMVIFFTTVGLSLEIYTGISHGKFDAPGNAQHATMFFFFGLTAFINLLAYFKIAMPKDLDYVMGAIAFTIEWVLFRFHLHGRTPLDVLLHTLLMYVIGANILSIFIELKYRDQVLAPLLRSYLVILQGTWFWQVGFILYNPNPDAEKWDEESHRQMMTATMYFAWHLGVVFLLMLIINCVVAAYYNKLLYRKDNKIEMESLIKSESNGYTCVSMADSDDDFEKASIS
ncbi:hypothetical protein KUTeg_023841 [Tegillarca granosa]|uniref:Transmembrane protein 45B n=1 Tax=Tegillarca granosa TaxID=220873 RepID=A0ABQ9E2V4_TEGGR|nr:hypothetical protein KUTeg_023841 [Tegillarca granosa]